MVEWSAFFEGLNQLLTWNMPFIMFWGVFFGILCGAIPGFTSSMAVAVLLPITYSMDAMLAMVFLSSTYVGAIYGGSITAILLNAPGTPGAAATALDGYEMTKKGKANEALGLALGSSCFGGLVSYLFLLVAMYPIAAFAVKFGPPEMFLLAILGLTIIGSLRAESFSKTILAGLLGVFMSTVGIAPTGTIRATFGQASLLDGLPLIPSIIGFFAFSELFYMINKEFVTEENVDTKKTKRNIREIIVNTFRVGKYIKNLIRSSIIGTFIGAIPAAGATVASFVSYNQAKQSSDNPGSFGKGNPEGIIASETSNNASTGGAMATMFALGIPGSGTTAMMLGALLLHGLRPGPRLFIHQMPLVYAIIAALFLSQFFMFVLGVGFSYSLSGILAISTKILVPVIAVLCTVGSFALRNNLFDVGLMFAFGILGWIMKENEYPTIAVVLGIILGPIADAELIRTTIRYGGDYLIFFQRPISIGLIVAIILMVFMPYYLQKRRGTKNNKENIPTEGERDFRE
jgi:putative tricarboxylic transport membrane protein